MSTQGYSKKSLAHSNEKKGKRKSRHYDLKDQEGVVCDDEQHGASFVSDRVTIPDSSKHLDLVGKALCRKHYNKSIVNAKKIKTYYVCSHPKHQVYVSSARSSTETRTLSKFQSIWSNALRQNEERWYAVVVYTKLMTIQYMLDHPIICRRQKEFQKNI